MYLLCKLHITYNPGSLIVLTKFQKDSCNILMKEFLWQVFGYFRAPLHLYYQAEFVLFFQRSNLKLLDSLSN